MGDFVAVSVADWQPHVWEMLMGYRWNRSFRWQVGVTGVSDLVAVRVGEVTVAGWHRRPVWNILLRRR